MRLDAAVAAVLLLLAAAPAYGARSEGAAIAVDAHGAAIGSFHLAADTTVTFTRALVAGGGDYAGFAVYGSDGRLRGGVLTIPAATAAGVDRSPVALGPSGPTVLAKGWYRVVVLTDAPIRIRVPVEAGPGARVVGTAPHQQTFGVVRRDLAARQPVVADLRQPLPAGGAGTRAVVLARVEPAYAEGDYALLACAPRRAEPCGRDTKTHLTGSGAPMGGSFVAVTGFSTRLPPGRRDAFARADLTPVVPATFTLTALQWRDPAPQDPY